MFNVILPSNSFHQADKGLWLLQNWRDLDILNIHTSGRREDINHKQGRCWTFIPFFSSVAPIDTSSSIGVNTSFFQNAISCLGRGESRESAALGAISLPFVPLRLPLPPYREQDPDPRTTVGIKRQNKPEDCAWKPAVERLISSGRPETTEGDFSFLLVT